MVTRHPALNVMAAASGSAQMLNSAAGVTFPRPAEPPMMTKSRTQPASRGSRRTASAMLVSGPVATRVISPGAALICSMMKSTAWPRAGSVRVGGRLAAPSPDSPCTSRASATGRSSGCALPGTTGTSGQPARSSTLSALPVTLPRSTFPLTVVTPARSRPGWPQPNTMASASSIPGSQSRMTRVGGGWLTNPIVGLSQWRAASGPVRPPPRTGTARVRHPMAGPAAGRVRFPAWCCCPRAPRTAPPRPPSWRPAACSPGS